MVGSYNGAALQTAYRRPWNEASLRSRRRRSGCIVQGEPTVESTPPTRLYISIAMPSASPVTGCSGCNANLPDSIVVKSAQFIDAEFHARFSALSRRYRYLIYNTDVRSAHGSSYLCWVRQALDVESMQREAQALLGEQDFSSFRAAACQSSTAMRHVDFIEVYTRRELVVVDIQANAFLHHMVRNIVGTLIAVGRGRCASGWVGELLALKDRTRASDTAPAAGLYLVAVNYPPRFDLQTGAPGPVFLAD